MKEQVDPKLYGLHPRTILMKTGSDKFVLEINRKSRIIMKDDKTILKRVETIKEHVPDAMVSLETTAPVCSKSIQFLNDNGVAVFQVPDSGLNLTTASK